MAAISAWHSRATVSNTVRSTGSRSQGRAADDLENLAGRGLDLQRGSKLACAVVDLPLQPGIGFLEPLRHSIEAVRKCFEFVACADRDAMVELAGAEFSPRRSPAPGSAGPSGGPAAGQRHWREPARRAAVLRSAARSRQAVPPPRRPAAPRTPASRAVDRCVRRDAPFGLRNS